jgi:hypothetical protein
MQAGRDVTAEKAKRGTQPLPDVHPFIHFPTDVKRSESRNPI